MKFNDFSITESLEDILAQLTERDEGKHNNGKTTGFKTVAKKAAAEYGSKEAGERVAGAVRAKMAKAGKLEEEKWIHTDPAKKGMFKGKDKAEIDSEKAALKKKHANQKGPISAADKTRMHELQFASRAKSKHGLE